MDKIDEQEITKETLKVATDESKVKRSKRVAPRGRQIVLTDVAVHTTKRHAMYAVSIDSEDYSDAPSSTVPNASMTIEAIYKRIAQGKPVVDNLMQSMTSIRDDGYDGQFKDSEASLNEAWEHPYQSPCGTLDRVEEEAQRVNRIAKRLKDLEDSNKQKQAEPQQPQEPQPQQPQEPQP